jgi:hypothetical protein
MKGQDRRHLALFAYYFPPLGGAGSLRALSFARHLPDLGWDVTVLTPKEGVYGRDPSLEGEGLPGVRVVRTGTWEPSVLLKGLRGGAPGGAAGAGGEFVEEADLGAVGSAVRTLVRKTLYFPDSSRGWIGTAVKAARREHARRPFDAVLSSSPPMSAHVAAQRFAGAAGVPLVLDFRDLWEPALEEGPSRGRRLLKDLLGACGGLVTVSGSYAGWFRAAGLRAKSGLVFNGWEDGPAAPPPAAAAGAGGPYVLHAGTTYAGRQDFAALCGAFEDAGRAGGGPRLRLVGRVDAATREAVGPFRDRGVASIEPFRAHEEVRGLLRGAAALLVVAWSGGDAVARGHVPAKLFEVLPARRPVLLLAEPGSDADSLGRRLGLLPLAPGDREGLARRLAALGRGEVPAGLLPDAGAAAEFARRRQAEALAAMLDSVLAARASR